MTRTPNAQPSRCELCTAVLPADGAGRPRYKCVVQRNGRGIPITLYACAKCHYNWLHPATASGQLTLLAA